MLGASAVYVRDPKSLQLSSFSSCWRSRHTKSERGGVWRLQSTAARVQLPLLDPQVARELGIVKSGDLIGITAGLPDQNLGTNLFEVHRVP